MGYFAVTLFVAVLTLILLGVSGCSPRSKTEEPPVVVTTAAQIQGFDRQAIRDLLQRLSHAPPPASQMGAMCYEPRALLTRAEYICPTCGERSVYENGMANRIEWDIPAARREYKELEKAVEGAAKLDESQFCRKCSGEVEQPQLVLTLHYAEGKDKVISGITSNDLRILREFLAGKVVHVGDADGESPLRDQIPRLKELLGVEPQ